MASKVPITPPSRATLIEKYHEEELNYQQIAEIYGVSMSTVHKWMKDYRIKARGKAELKKIGGVDHKLCRGPKHKEGGEWLPLERFYRNAGKSFGRAPRCAECMNYNARVLFTPQYQAWVISIIRRLGVMETCRRLEIHNKTLRTWLGKNPHRVKPEKLGRRHAEAIVRVIGELRITDEVRHRHSITRGATARGEKERSVTSQADLYVRHGDNDAAYKRKRRQEEEFRQRENETSRRSRAKRREGLTKAA